MSLRFLRNRAFTLVELIVVITILAVLATVGFLAMQGYAKDAKDSVLKTNARSIAKAVEMEASVGSQNPRQFISHSGVYVMSGTILGTTLSGGTF
jgi:prepilin-type N-terminal cleavage/methylation domain-containing protein